MVAFQHRDEHILLVETEHPDLGGLLLGLLRLGLHEGPDLVADLAGHHALVSAEGPHVCGTLLRVVVHAALGDLKGLLLGQVHLELLGQAVGVVALLVAEDAQLDGRAGQVLAHVGLIGEDQVLQLGDLVVAQRILLEALHADFPDLLASLGRPVIGMSLFRKRFHLVSTQFELSTIH